MIMSIASSHEESDPLALKCYLILTYIQLQLMYGICMR